MKEVEVNLDVTDLTIEQLERIQMKHGIDMEFKWDLKNKRILVPLVTIRNG